jgi:hypothetical protein
MRIYLAARYSRLDELLRYRDDVIAKGHAVTSRWLNGDHRAVGGDTTRWAEFADDDLEDIETAHALIHFAQPPRTPSRGGRFVEVGYALATGLRVYNVGPMENVFLAVPDVENHETWESCLDAL